MPVQNVDKLVARLQAARAAGRAWREIAADFPGVAPGTLCSIAKGREPKGARIRKALGLPAMAPAPICPIHGVVHSRQCRPLPEWVKLGADFLAEKEKQNGYSR